MNDKQLMWLIRTCVGHNCEVKELVMSENGDMTVSFWDAGCNWHQRVIHADGTFSTIE